MTRANDDTKTNTNAKTDDCWAASACVDNTKQTRPRLSDGLDPQVFGQWYWLKSELRAFCVEQGLGGQGSKSDLHSRVASYLQGTTPPSTGGSEPRQQRAEGMPGNLSANTCIGQGWKLNAQLRAFFEAHVTGTFRFNQALRDLFKEPRGRTLGDALTLYESTRHQKNSIERQFEYNQHMRDYFATHSESTWTEAVQAWRDRRAHRSVDHPREGRVARGSIDGQLSDPAAALAAEHARNK